MGFLLARNFTLSTFSLFVDTLRLASDEQDFSGRKYLDWDVLSDTSQLIKSSCGVFVAPTARLNLRDQYDYLVVVGGRLNIDEPFSFEQIDYIRQFDTKRGSIIALCTASFALANAGVLDGRIACVSWLHRHEFQLRYPDIAAISDKLFVRSGNIYTCAGGTAAADLAADIVEKHLGCHLASKAMQILQIERRRSGADFQARVPIGQVVPKDIRVRQAILIMEQFVDSKWDVEWLASRLCITRRHLERLFKQEYGTGPRAIFTRIRLEQARVLLVNTEQPISQIASELGYDTQGQFSRQFRMQFGSTPSDIRLAARP